jgi:hypothetical protein
LKKFTSSKWYICLNIISFLAHRTQRVGWAIAITKNTLVFATFLLIISISTHLFIYLTTKQKNNNTKYLYIFILITMYRYVVLLFILITMYRYVVLLFILITMYRYVVLLLHVYHHKMTKKSIFDLVLRCMCMTKVLKDYPSV